MSNPQVIDSILVGNSPRGVATDGTYVWVTNANSNTVSQIQVSTATVINTISVGNDPNGVATYGPYVWVANFGSNTVSQIQVSTATVINTISVGNNPFTVATDGTYVWVTNYTNSTVSQIQVSSATVINTITVGTLPVGVATDGTYVWVTNSNTNTVSQIQVSTATVINTINVGTLPVRVATDGTYVWVTNANSNTVSQIQVSSATVINTIPVDTYPVGVATDGTYVWVTNSDTNTVSQIQIAPPQPTSNICFPAGTPVKTDQGIINIELIDPTKHTINNEAILYITKTVTLDKYLICFEKSSLSRNIPDKRTIMSKDHKINFDGQFVPAERFLNYSREVKKVQYRGEVLYNVLLEHYGTMNINGIMCETLHPENIIAKLYTNNYSEKDRNVLIVQMNDSLKQKDLVKYKNVIQKLC